MKDGDIKWWQRDVFFQLSRRVKLGSFERTILVKAEGRWWNENKGIVETLSNGARRGHDNLKQNQAAQLQRSTSTRVQQSSTRFI